MFHLWWRWWCAIIVNNVASLALLYELWNNVGLSALLNELWYCHVISLIYDHCEVLYELCVCMKSSMCSSNWIYVIMIGYSDAYMCIVEVEVWIFLVDYMNLLMSYVDHYIVVCRVTCSILSWPYILLEWYCTCDKMIMTSVLFW